MPPALLSDFDRNGYAIVGGALGTADIDTLVQALDRAQLQRLTRGAATFGARNLLEISAVRDVAGSPALRDLVESIVGPTARPVRASFLDKTLGANWPVLWHQDLALAVAERHEIAGWGPWSVKAGIPHVQPPPSLLEAMVAVRLHLDDCDANNGPLRVLPGTHRRGRLSREGIQALRAEIVDVVCEARRGDALLMRPLLLHASSPARVPNHRRVLHLEFAPEGLLPQPLSWAH